MKHHPVRVVIFSDLSSPVSHRTDWDENLANHRIKIRKVGSRKEALAWLEEHPKRAKEVLVGKIVPAGTDGALAVLTQKGHGRLASHTEAQLVAQAKPPHLEAAVHLLPYKL